MSHAAPLAGFRILVVEDDYNIASELTMVLRQAGATVVGPHPDAEAALAALAGGRPDGAVLDIHLGPGITAYPVADRLEQLGVPYLFATGNVLRPQDPMLRGRPYLEKPISDRLLVRSLAQLLAPAETAPGS
ncbi:response regulator [Roseomonas sp. 18066]|uniref:response regulator n=1 Tax=Roseomonas sp. 18066 TaxID=2681412 RepID=UPI00135BA578|nr:response regulator [Roseomonas sp. 18066]